MSVDVPNEICVETVDCRCPVYVVASQEFSVSCLVDWDLAPATVPTISVPCVILQLPDQLHQSGTSSHPARPIRAQSRDHGTFGFHCVRAKSGLKLSYGGL